MFSREIAVLFRRLLPDRLLAAGRKSCDIRKKLERAKGLEPSTPTLARSCSTTELHPHPMPAIARRQRQSYAKCGPRMQQQATRARNRPDIRPIGRSAGQIGPKARRRGFRRLQIGAASAN